MSADAAPLPAASATHTLTFTVDGTGNVGCRFDPRRDTTCKSVFALYASVQLVSASVSVQGFGASGLLYASILYSTAGDRINEFWRLNSPYLSFAFLTAQTSTQVSTSLPADHLFGRELKTVSVGEPSPVFVVGTGGVAEQSTDSVMWAAKISITVAGHGHAAIPTYYLPHRSLLSAASINFTLSSSQDPRGGNTPSPSVTVSGSPNAALRPLVTAGSSTSGSGSSHRSTSSRSHNSQPPTYADEFRA